ncbi:MAG: sensor domain-containing diguanylate cyclase [Planctomycetota bacterium]
MSTSSSESSSSQSGRNKVLSGAFADGSEYLSNLRLFPAIVDGLKDPVIVTDDAGAIRYLNASALNEFGAGDVDAACRQIGELLKLVRFDGKCLTNELQCEFPEGKRAWVEIERSQICLDGNCMFVNVVRNVQARKTREADLKRAAVTDSLSGLNNRREFQAILESSVSGGLSLAIIDIDDFKQINDKYGHLTGDQAIEFVALKLREYFSDAVCIARLGGDEFGILLKLEGVTTDLVESVDELVHQIAKSEFSECGSRMTVSAGIASADKATTARNILTVADMALYEAKRDGKNRVIARSCDDEESDQ